MPPEGKPQPATAEIELLEWWVAAGADDKKVSQLQPPTRIAALLAARFGGPAPANTADPKVSPQPLEQILPLAAPLAQGLGIVIEPLSAAGPWLQCNASLAGTNFGDAELAKLGALAANLHWLDLAGTRVTDSGLSAVTSMQNLKRLHLERTSIGDAGLRSLSQLSSLEYLNLYGTHVTDAGLEQLRDLPRLKDLYLWQTQVTPAAAATFAESRTDKDQLQRWQAELEQLQLKIRDARVVVEIGAPSGSNLLSSATNQVCPVSGKPVDPLKTIMYQGTTVAFCCDDCRAQFQKDPTPFRARLGLKPQMPERSASKAP
jgi:YHS domain-containing protein/Leucine-rich repeat (LRR) protein